MNNPFLKLFYIFGLAFFIFSCHSKPSKWSDYTPQQAIPLEDTLKAKVISLNVNLLNVGRIRNINNRFLITIGDRKKGFLKVFRLPKVKYLYSWGRKGNGPHEFSHIPTNSLSINNNQLIFYKFPIARIASYLVTDTTLSFQWLKLLACKNIHILDNVQRLTDSIYIATIPEFNMVNYSYHEFMALSPGDTIPLYTFGNYPTHKNLKTQKLYKLYQKYTKNITTKPDGSRIATFYSTHDALKIYDGKGHVLEKIKINDPYIADDGDNKFFYRITTEASNKYIYALAANLKVKTLKNLDPQKFRPSFEIWNWKGKPVYRVMLDQPVQRFAISEKYKKLYGLSVFNKQKIYVYDLSKFFRSKNI
jgi:hypothetical protein